MPPVVNIVAPDGRTRAVEVDSAEYKFAIDSGWVPESGAEAAGQAGTAFAQRGMDLPGAGILAGAAAVARGVTGGLSDVALDQLGGGEFFGELRDAHPYASLGGEVLGAITPTGIGGLAARAGERVAARIGGEGVGAALARTAVKGGTEGAIQGIGTGISQVSLADDPLSVEQIASVLSSNALLGGGVGGGLNVVGKGLDLTLSKASKKLREFGDRATTVAETATPATFPGAPTYNELPPPKLTKSGKPSKRSPAVVREMRVGDLDDVKLARLRELSKEGKAVDTMERLELAHTARLEAVNSKGKLPASHGLNKPIDLVMGPDGDLRLVDGYVRLSSLPRAANIKVRIRAGDATAGARPPAIADNFADLDAKAIREAQQAEREAIEAARVADRPMIADDIAAHRVDTKDEKLFLATESTPPKIKGKRAAPLTDEQRELAAARKVHLDADRQIDRLLTNPKDLAANPGQALRALRQEEYALERIVEMSGQLAEPPKGKRATSLAAIPRALERNRALQQRIATLAGKPTSSRLVALEEAAQRLADKTAAAAAQDGAGGGLLGVAAAAAGPLPLVGGLIATGGRIGQSIKKAAGAVAKRTAGAIDAVLGAAKKGAPVLKRTPVIASKVLSSVVFAPPSSSGRERSADGESSLASLYKRRSAEIRSQTAFGPAGVPVMRPAARQQIADHLRAIAAIDPKLADRLESIRAHAIEFLAGKLPRRPDLDGVALANGGTDLWQPSDMEIRTWARYVAAVEDPGGVEERISDGSITPEDAEAYRAVYPERMASITTAIMSRLPTLQAKLPYHRRLALSIFTGVPIDPALDPRVLSVLQSQYVLEEGAEGGTQAPRAMPAFGSVRSQEKPTPAQERAG